MSARTDTMATVTAVNPLRVRLDGEAAALAVTPADMVGALAVADRVYVAIIDGSLIVVGRPGGVVSRVANRNLIRNSAGNLNQRGNGSGTPLPNGQYFVDGWRNTSGLTTPYLTFTGYTVQTFTIGLLGGGGNAMAQTIENVDINPGLHTLSWEGNALGRVYNAGWTAPAFGASPFTYNLSNTAGVIVEFWGAGWTMTKPKLEAGSVATPWEMPVYASELARCQRYFAAFDIPSGQYIAAGAYWTTTDLVAPLKLPVRMRSAPTVTFSAASNFDVLATNANRACSAISATTSTPDAIGIAVATATSGLTGAAGVLRGTNYSAATGHIYADAEL